MLSMKIKAPGLYTPDLCQVFVVFAFCWGAMLGIH